MVVYSVTVRRSVPLRTRLAARLHRTLSLLHLSHSSAHAIR